MKKNLNQCLWIFFSVFFISCGIENYLYLNQVPQGNIKTELVSKATIILPHVDSEAFTHFTIYYRIYISDQQLADINLGDFSNLNSTLSSDYNAFLPYINSDTTISTSIGTIFRNRNYQTLAVAGMNIETEVLDKTVQGKTVVLDFIQTPGSIPRLIIDNAEEYPYYLQRSNNNGLFRLVPGNGYFLNTSDLHSTEVSDTVNKDVAWKNVSGSRYTYVAMYIVVTGIDSNFSPIYSAPTFIGVFRLPDPY
jgi:hypothetical protein